MFKISNLKMNLENGPSDTLTKWLLEFNNEISLYDNITMDGEPWRLYTESPMLGFLASAIIRSDSEHNTVLLQEFGVHDDGIYNGRCDLIVINNKDVYLIEAKFLKGSYGIREWTKPNYENFVKKIDSQLDDYYNSEIQAYNIYNNIYLISLVFMRVEGDQLVIANYLDNSELNLPVQENSFYMAISLSDLTQTDYKKASCLEIFGHCRHVKK